ncbi:MAG: glycosyltransferase [Staphylothermus sp.]|nr:glycosyltransferase [Staphylothermus sp.]
MSRKYECVIVRHHMAGAKFLGVGGSEYTALEVAIGLAKHGFEVFLQGIELSKPEKLIKLAEFYGIPKEELRGIGIGPSNKHGKCVVFNTSGDMLSGPSHIIYFHFPSIINPQVYYPGIKGFMRLGGTVYSLVNLLLSPISMRKTVLMIANSTLTANFIKKLYGIEPVVVHPPVNIKEIISQPVLPRDRREKYFLIVSRISYEKQPHKVLILSSILKKLGLRGWKILLVGARGRYSDRIIKELYEKASFRGLSEYIEIRTNVDRDKLIDYFRSAYAYIHITEKEHFGISVVEAMAAGTPVIVPKSSGSWIDVVNMDNNYGLGYSDYFELENCIKKIVNDKNTWIKLSRNARRRAKRFSRDRFHKEISRYTELVISKLTGDEERLRT